MGAAAAEYANDFRIDESRLDAEWMRQPTLMRRYGEWQADAHFRRDRAKAALELKAAQLRHLIRAAPADFGLEKPTVDDVAGAIVRHPDYQELQAAYLRECRAADVAKAAVTALIDKRKALESAVELLRLEYQSEREPRAGADVTRKMADSARRDVRGGADDGGVE